MIRPNDFNQNNAPIIQNEFSIETDDIWLVQQHTVSKWLAVIPIFGWLYMLVKSCLKSTALNRLKNAVITVAPSAKLNPEQQRLYGAATDVLLNHLSTPESRLQVQKNRFQREIQQAFVLEQQKPNFHILTRYYLFLSDGGHINSIPDKMIEDNVYKELMNVMASYGKELSQSGYSQRFSEQLIDLWLREMLPAFPKAQKHNLECVDHRTYLLEADILTRMGTIFGDLWTPDFIERIFPIYLDLATYPLEAGLEITQALLDCLPYDNAKLHEILGEHRIEVDLLNKLKQACANLNDTLQKDQTLTKRFNSPEEWIKNTIPGQYGSTSCDVIMNTVIRLLTLWNDPKYQTENKSDLFKYLLKIGSIDDSEQTLHQIDGFLSLDQDLFQGEDRTYKRDAEVTFFEYCNQVFSDKILKDVDFADKKRLFKICMALRPIGSDADMFWRIEHRVVRCLEDCEQEFEVEFKKWEKLKGKIKSSGIHFIDSFMENTRKLQLQELMINELQIGRTPEAALHIFDGLTVLIPDFYEQLNEKENIANIPDFITACFYQCGKYLTDDALFRTDNIWIIQTALALRTKGDNADAFKVIIDQVYLCILQNENEFREQFKKWDPKIQLGSQFLADFLLPGLPFDRTFQAIERLDRTPFKHRQH